MAYCPRPRPSRPMTIRLNPKATFYETLDRAKETMFSKTLCRTAVYSHLQLPRDAVTFFKNPIVGSSTADRQKVTYVILFYDDTGKGWEFTYRQWQKRDDYGHYFSKGWRNFLKARHLKENDTVTFSRGQTNQEQFFIGYTRAGNINEAIQQPSGGDSGQPAALLSSRTSDQGSPSPSAIAFADSILETENMEHSLSVARVRGPEITVLPVGSPSFNASGTGIVPNTAVTDRSPTLNSDQVISTLNFDQITSTLNPEQITSTLRIQFFELLHKINELALEYDYGMRDMIFKLLLKFIKEYTTTTEEQEAQNQIMPIQALFSRMRNMQVTISNRIQPFTLQ